MPAAGAALAKASDDDVSDSASSTISLLEDTEIYVPVSCKRNKHFGAADLENNEEFKPGRRDLYGHRPYMVLTKGGTDTGGTLGLGPD